MTKKIEEKDRGRRPRGLIEWHRAIKMELWEKKWKREKKNEKRDKKVKKTEKKRGWDK